MKLNKKILVVGASIAGPVLCYWLKKYGFSPTLIERSKQLRTGGYAIDIRGIATDIIKKMNIYDTVSTKRTLISSTRYVDYAGNTISEEHEEKSGFREYDDIEIVRGDLVKILLEAIPGVPCFFDEEIISLTQNDLGVEVTFKDSRTECYDLVLAADGLHSSTRSMAFSDESWHVLSLNSYISVFSIPNYLNLNREEVIFGKDQKHIALNNDKDPNKVFACLAFRTKKQLSGLTNDKEQKEILRKFFYDLGWESNKILEFMNDSDDIYFDSIAQIKMDSWTEGRVALVGDAGYCASPLSGQGTNLAIVGSYILAGELKSAKGNYSIAFNRYNELMRPFVDTNQDLGAFIGESFLSEEEASKEIVEHRSNVIMDKIKIATHAIELPKYL